MSNLTWVKTAQGYEANSTTGLYEARRSKSGRFALWVDGVDQVENATTLADCKDRAEVFHEDRSSRKANGAPGGTFSVESPDTEDEYSPHFVRTGRPTPGHDESSNKPYSTSSAEVVPSVSTVSSPDSSPTIGAVELSGLMSRIKPDVVDTAAPHLIVEARAGTGKTTTLVSAVQILFDRRPTDAKGRDITPSPQQKAVWDCVALSKGKVKTAAFVAFNKSIANELRTRVPVGCDAMTMHSMGFKAINRAFPGLRVEEYRTANMLATLRGENTFDLRKKHPLLIGAVDQLVSLLKMNLVGYDFTTQKFDPDTITDDNLDRIVSHYGIDLDGVDVATLYEWSVKVLTACADPLKDGCIEFGDMIWLPVVLDLPVFRYDILLVDEAQDLNLCQQALAKRAGKRLVLCGDPKQAIYGFAGADAESMPRMARELGAETRGCKTLPLTVTRRCGKAIVREANKIVPDFSAHESNCEGTVSRAHLTEDPDNVRPGTTHYRQLARDGDMVLCRVNAPLVSQCFKFLKEGRKANIQGRDVAKGLVTTVRKAIKAGVVDVAGFVGWIGAWQDDEIMKESAKKNPSDGKIIAIQDRHDCLICFTDGLPAESSPEGIVAKIERVFTDQKDAPGIRLSSIHKAKGLEAHRVFLLQPEGGQCPHPMAKLRWEKEQEQNLLYVAVTRAVEELVIVEG